jgi:hypothetical protein
VQTGPASAEDGNGCRIAPGYTFAFEGVCVNDKPASSYAVAFHQQAPEGSTFSWTITGDWTSVVSGCGPTSSYCTVRTPGSSADREVHAHVVANGVASGYRAFIRAYCGSYLC